MNKVNPKPAGEESEPRVPTDLRKALAAAPLAKAQWNDLTPIARWDFISWIPVWIWGGCPESGCAIHRAEDLVGDSCATFKRRVNTLYEETTHKSQSERNEIPKVQFS
jgi:hypothetical protein